MTVMRRHVLRAFIWGSKEEPKGCTSSFTVYCINVYFAGNSLEVRRRYSQFYDLNEQISNSFPNLSFKVRFPPKQTIVLNRKTFIQARINSLNSCLAEWTQDPNILDSGSLHKFFGLEPGKFHRHRRSFDLKHRSPSGRRGRNFDPAQIPNPIGNHPSKEGGKSQNSAQTVCLPLRRGRSKEFKFVKPKTPPCLQGSSHYLKASSRTSTLCTVPEHQDDPDNTITNLMNETAAENNPSHVPGYRDFLPPNRNISQNSSSTRDSLDKNQSKVNVWDTADSPELAGRMDNIRKISWDLSGDIVTPAGQLSAERKAVAYEEMPQHEKLPNQNSGEI
mmetsp:Transcript_16998/g.23794  ORF Transcript_16998/g.23794 Transcript_16998/m.23794 type:complete len:333 (-) Transcript_16998:548-1546(-)